MSGKIEISREKIEYLLKLLATGGLWQIKAVEVDLNALLAAPAVERQEPVGFRYRAHGGHWEWMDESPFADGREHYRLGGEELQPLYSSPPAPVAVVLPDHEFRETVNRLRAISEMYGHTEQLRERISMELRACLDKVKEMNE